MPYFDQNNNAHPLQVKAKFPDVEEFSVVTVDFMSGARHPSVKETNDVCSKRRWRIVDGWHRVVALKELAEEGGDVIFPTVSSPTL